MTFFIVSLFISLCILAVTNCADYYQIDGRRYFSSYPDKRNWYEAKDFCATNGTYLIDVQSEAENLRILSVINQTENKNNLEPVNWWTSGTDLKNENYFYWNTTGEMLKYEDWADNQPDNGRGGNEHCVLYWKHQNHKWNDADCTNFEYYFICRDSVDVVYSGTGSFDNSRNIINCITLGIMIFINYAN